MSEQEENVGRAIARLEELGVAADGHIVITRNPRKSILREAVRHGCAAIVMGADPQRNWLIGSMMWSQEPYRVRRGAPIPVHLVETSAATAARSRMEPASKAPAKLRLVLNEKNIHHS
jgi:hypothetical protein